MNQASEQLKARTEEFALSIVRLWKVLPRAEEARVIGRQVLRSGTSVAANYRAACRARSKAEFIAKIGIVVEEIDETVFWLELVGKSKLVASESLKPLYKESKELFAIFTASQMTAKNVVSNSNSSLRKSENPSILRVKLLRDTATAPVCAHPGEDLGYDVFAAESVTFQPRSAAIVPTAISVELADAKGRAMGALLRDKSSLAARRLIVTAGVIDAGYRGEIKVVMENLSDQPQEIRAGDKIANLIPYPVLTGTVEVVEELAESRRMAGGFGSTGRN
jgi:dUTP pyrophosphatase